MWQQLRMSVILATLATLIGLVVIKFTLAPLPIAKLANAEQGKWEIPTVYKEDSKLKIEQLIGRNLWKEPVTGLNPAAEEKPLTPPDWRIGAVIKVGSTNQVAINFKDNPNNLQTLSVGDKLPGNFPIVRIEQNWIVIQINGKQYMLAVGRN